MLMQRVVISASALKSVDAITWENHIAALMHLNILTPVLVSFSDDNWFEALDANTYAYHRLRSLFHNSLFGLYYDASDFDENKIIKLLDNGVATLVMTEATLSPDNNLEIQHSLASLPRSRLGISVSSTNWEGVISKWRDHVMHFYVKIYIDDAVSLPDIIDRIIAIVKSRGPSVEIYVEFESRNCPHPSIITDMLNRSEHLHVSLPSSIKAQRLTPETQYLSLLSSSEPLNHDSDILDYFLSQLKSDRVDGLITTIVCDERNQCLGLVYSNHESISLAFLERKGIYWSRSRQSLWRKGDSSGMVQYLLDMRLDCDRDALKMRVKQGGNPPAFCHLLSYSCWGHSNGPFSELGGVTHLQQTLQERLLHAPKGSYTKRLFEDKNLLQQKLLEEAQELIEAETKEDIAAEAADVMYFMMVRCIQAGVEFQDIEQYLDLRAKKITRRPGHAKDWRIAQAAQILGSTSSSSVPDTNANKST